jgi:hypothetical protein
LNLRPPGPQPEGWGAAQLPRPGFIGISASECVPVALKLFPKLFPKHLFAQLSLLRRVLRRAGSDQACTPLSRLLGPGASEHLVRARRAPACSSHGRISDSARIDSRSRTPARSRCCRSLSESRLASTTDAPSSGSCRAVSSSRPRSSCAISDAGVLVPPAASAQRPTAATATSPSTSRSRIWPARLRRSRRRADAPCRCRWTCPAAQHRAVRGPRGARGRHREVSGRAAAAHWCPPASTRAFGLAAENSWAIA